ncbi:hypothetical protein [Prochlorococcus sp. MIT 1341]|uniref:hypothetical protein n=1 Tax=Prochlorococcus sp. MIT 1341 TaxID=3096221 RepID=UPI002A75A62C|nr:hypothetical protein [Prochlorococcus sp. MIT 1341]
MSLVVLGTSPTPIQPSISIQGSKNPDKEERTTLRYKDNKDFYVIDLDSRKVQFSLLEGWRMEQQAYEDMSALAYVSGPMYETDINKSNNVVIYHLGDLKFNEKILLSRNRAASLQRAFIGVKYNGVVDFGYGELTKKRIKKYKIFIGGLHSIYNDLQEAPSNYKGGYHVSISQRIRYYLPRIRVIYGLRRDGRIEILMSKTGLTYEQTKELGRRRNLLTAYLPDHGSKSRLIVPSRKKFTAEDLNWNSSLAISNFQTPYMIRIQRKEFSLRTDLFRLDSISRFLFGNKKYEQWVSNLSGQPSTSDKEKNCITIKDCSKQWLGILLDRALAGFNRIAESWIDPIIKILRQELK